MSYPGYPGYGGAGPSYPPYPSQPQPEHATSSLSYPGVGFQPHYPSHNSMPQPGGYPSQAPYPQTPAPAPPSYPPYHPSANSSYPPAPNPYPPAANTYSHPPTTNPYPSSTGTPYTPYGYQPNTGFGASPHANYQPSNPYPNPTMPSASGSLYPNPSVPSATPLPGNHYSVSMGPVRKANPTVQPVQPFDPRNDAEVLRKAMKGFGTDEKAIINVLARRSNLQRQEIALQFKTLFGKDLVSDLKSELTGKFEDLAVALMKPYFEFMAKEVHDAIAGLGTDEETVIEVVCSANNQDTYAIKTAYHHMYNRTLEDDLRGDTSGSFKRLMVSLCVGNRSEDNNVNPTQVQADAQALLRAGELRVGTDESAFNAVLCQRSYAHLQAVMIEYQRITGHSLEKAIKKEFSGDIEQGLVTILKCVENRPGYFAERLYKSMKGLGTDDRALIRLIVSRCEIDMGDIKQAFEAQYGKTLASFISGDCSGDYKKCLLALIGEY